MESPPGASTLPLCPFGDAPEDSPGILAKGKLGIRRKLNGVVVRDAPAFDILVGYHGLDSARR